MATLEQTTDEEATYGWRKISPSDGIESLPEPGSQGQQVRSRHAAVDVAAFDLQDARHGWSPGPSRCTGERAPASFARGEDSRRLPRVSVWARGNGRAAGDDAAVPHW